jgi:hypothetical protein
VRSASQSAAEWISYLVLALVAVAPGLGHDSRLVGEGVDLYGTTWFYWWVRHCGQTGQDPGFTDLMFHPFGKDIFAHTGGNFIDAIASIPFQSILGPQDYQPWFVAAVLLANGLCFRVLMRGLCGSSTAVWTATMLWMVNPFTLFEISTGRITQAFLVFLPLAFHHFLRIDRGDRRSAVLAGVFTAAQAWTYWFMGWFMALGLAIVAVSKWRQSGADRGLLSRRIALSAAVCGLCVLPAVVVMLGRLTDGLVPGMGGAGGLSGFFDALQGDGGRALQGWQQMTRDGAALFGGWFWAFAGGLVLWSSKSRGIWGLGMVAALLFAIGPQLSVGIDLPMPHYLLAYHVLPFLERLWFPYRWIVMAFFSCCVGLGLVVSDVIEHGWKGRRWAVPLMMLPLALIEPASLGGFPIKAQVWAPPAVYGEIAKLRGGLIELPMEVSRASLMAQPVHQQPLFGGMGETAPVFWPEGFRHQIGNHFIRALRTAARTQDPLGSFSPADRERIQDQGFRWVVLDRHTLMRVLDESVWWRAHPSDRPSAGAWAVLRLSAILGPPVAADGALVVWDLEGGTAFLDPLSPTQERIDGREWAGPSWTAYESEIERLNAD